RSPFSSALIVAEQTRSQPGICLGVVHVEWLASPGQKDCAPGIAQPPVARVKGREVHVCGCAATGGSPLVIRYAGGKTQKLRIEYEAFECGIHHSAEL